MQLEEIQGQMLGLGRLVALQEHRDPDFVPEMIAWLKTLEAAFEADALAEAALLAGLRSGIASAAAGNFPPGLLTRGQPTRSKVAGIVAGQALQRAAEIGTEIVAGNRARLAEAELVAQRIVAGLRARDLVPPEMGSHRDWLLAIRRVMAGSAEFEPAAVHLEGLLGQSDALIVLDRALAAHGLAVVETPSALSAGTCKGRSRTQRRRRRQDG